MKLIILISLLGSTVSLDDQSSCHSSSGPCLQNEIFNDCASCIPEPTCQVPIPFLRPCPRICEQRCECDRQRGYIRDEISNLCVLDRNCATDQQCGEFEFFNICGSNCIPEPTCQNPNPRFNGACIQSCKQRCDCDIYNGYIRDEVTGRCVRTQSCDVLIYPEGTTSILDTPVLACSNQETLNTCSSLCLPEPSCQNPYPQYHGVCPTVCLERCECNSTFGLIRDDLTGQCIPKDQCFSCNPSSQRPGCLSCCNNEDIPTCRNPQPVLACDCFVCSPGCVCADGFVLNENTGECIPQCDCPVY